MGFGIGVCPHRPWELALRIDTKEDLVGYFALRVRMEPHQHWSLDSKLTIPDPVEVPYLDSYPEVCVGCNKVLSASGSKLWWGCAYCKKHVRRDGYYFYLLEQKVHPETLDYAIAIAIAAATGVKLCEKLR